MNTEEQLISETNKWKSRIEEEITKVSAKNERGKEFIENIRAYISDSSYFTEKKDFVRAFEAIVWAWAILETGRKAEILE